jgi:hypothetical protein
MNEFYFPELDEFYERFCRAVQDSGIEGRFLEKWGLDSLSAGHDMLQNNVQGGYDSHRQTMLSASTGGSVLNIGPGLGFCVFLLAELYDTVYVAEPDRENGLLLGAIAARYRTHRGEGAGEVVQIFHAGMGITGEAVRYWQSKSALMKKRNLTGSILNFDISGARELTDVFRERVCRIYLHKVLSSLSISSTFENIIAQCRLFLRDGGILTWSEPEYIFADILAVGGENGLEQVLKSICANHRLAMEIDRYRLASGEPGTAPEENWTLIKARRLNNEAT